MEMETKKQSESMTRSHFRDSCNKPRREILNVSPWLNANKLTLNETKTEDMLIGSTKRLKQIKNDSVIKIKDYVIRRVYNKNIPIPMLRKIKLYVPKQHYR